MNFDELVQTVLGKGKRHPYTIALEGMIGSGKSYEAEKLDEQLGGSSIFLSTDLFVIVPRTEWDRRIENDDLDLRQWYDLPKIQQTVESIKNQENFNITGLYNLSNGKFDDHLEIDARNCDYMILEGLFSCDHSLEGLIDLKIFLNISQQTALNRAHERDETVRHLSHRGWLQKKNIFYDHYLPYLEANKDRADVLLDPS